MRIPIAVAILLAAAACDSPPATQPEDFDTVNATLTDQAAPPGALDNESVNYGEGSITPAERDSIHETEQQSPSTIVGQFANHIVRRQFEEARSLWDPKAADFTVEQLAEKFERYRTIQAEIGRTATAAGGGGAIEQVQLTLSGTTTDGSNYVLTGPVTLSRGNGSSVDQGNWRIAKVVLTGNPQAADALIEPQGGR
jgi:hypothetical protein